MGQRIFDKLSSPDKLYQDPILVFAADPLASGGIHGLGQVTVPKPHYRTHPEYLQRQRDLVRDGTIDGLLMTPADAEILALEEGMFHDSDVTPIVRMNSETAICNYSKDNEFGGSLEPNKLHNDNEMSTISTQTPSSSYV